MAGQNKRILKLTLTPRFTPGLFKTHNITVMKKVLLISAIAMTLLSCSKGQSSSDPQPLTSSKIKGELTVTVHAPAQYVFAYMGKKDTTNITGTLKREFAYVVGQELIVTIINAKGNNAEMHVTKDGVEKAAAIIGSAQFTPVIFKLN